MDALLQTISTWVDPKTLGDIALTWSGRLVAAALVFLISRVIAGTQTPWFRGAVGRMVATASYWGVHGDLMEHIKRTLEDNGLSIPFPQRDLHIVSQPAAGQ